MSAEEIIVAFDTAGFRSWYHDDEFQLASPCVENGQVMNERCYSNQYSTHEVVDLCAAELASVRQCYLQSGLRDHEARRSRCSLELRKLDICNRLKVYGPPGSKPTIQIFFSEKSSPSDWIMIHCGLFNGCEYTKSEILEFLLSSMGDQLARSTDDTVNMFDDGHNGTCMSGKRGEKICVREMWDRLWIMLRRYKFGRPTMDLSLN